ncbi:MAG TPA: carboxypeptidase regulatory-like domain-containing protein [Agromyces mariniharenae]|nr:carboxypeptidase regulatory-like domain-containing protein [Agromyces mariniharenae]
MTTHSFRRAGARALTLLLAVGLTAGAALGVAVPASADETSGTISGTIVGQGEPVVPLTGAAQVTAYPAGSTFASGFASANAGAFTLSGLPAGDYRLAVRQWMSSGWGDVPTIAGWSPTLDELATLPIVRVPAGGVTTTEVVLPRLASITGTVSSGMDGSPVGGASVSVRNETTGRGGYATTDAAGAYVIEGLAAGSYRLSVSAGGGFVPFEASEPVLVAAGTAVTGVDAVLRRGATISGIVTSTDGSPVTGSSVSIHRADRSIVNVAGVAADGSYTIDALPAGEYRLAFGALKDTPGEFIEEWYADAADFDSATVITVGEGERLVGFDAEIAPFADAIVPGTVAVVGNPTPGETLTVDSGVWTPALQSSRYQWLRDGEPIEGVFWQQYTVSEADLGSRISVRVTGSAFGVRSATTTSEPTKVVKERMAAGVPTIVGAPQVGSLLMVDPGDWTPDPVRYSYQWLRWGMPIDGATSRKYIPTAQDAGTSLSVRVTAHKPGWGPTSVVSAWTGPVQSLPIFAPLAQG